MGRSCLSPYLISETTHQIYFKFSIWVLRYDQFVMLLVISQTSKQFTRHGTTQENKMKFLFLTENVVKI
jgi:hypothetical protein